MTTAVVRRAPARAPGAPRVARALACAAAFALAALPLPALAADPSFSEYEVKAAFLRNFVKFVEWPSKPTGLFTLCILGQDPFKDALRGPDDVGGGRLLRYLRISKAREAAGCQALFVGPGERKAVPEILAALGDSEVLTVGDVEGMARDGLMFSFLIEGQKVRFEVNLDPVRRSRLSVNPKLLMLAKTVIASP